MSDFPQIDEREYLADYLTGNRLTVEELHGFDRYRRQNRVTPEPGHAVTHEGSWINNPRNQKQD